MYQSKTQTNNLSKRPGTSSRENSTNSQVRSSGESRPSPKAKVITPSPLAPSPSLLQPLNKLQMQKFIRYPKQSLKSTFQNAENKPEESQGSPPYQARNSYKENKYITDKINNYNQSRKHDAGSSSNSTSSLHAVLAPPQQRASTIKPKSFTNGTQGNTTSGTVFSANPIGKDAPGISSERHSANAKVGNSGESRPSPTVHSPPSQGAFTASPGATDFTPSMSDKALLQYLLEMKFLSYDQVERKFLNNQQTAGSFRNLLSGGYLKCKDGAPNPQSLIVPTEKAYELLKIENPDKEIPKPVKRVFEPAVNHDLKLVELRFRFEQLNFIKKWYSEKALEEVPMMNRLFKDLPDACCKKNNDKSYFLELEISKKSQKAYEERINEYQRILEIQEIKEYGIEGVIFLCTDEKVYDIIKSKLPNSKNFSCMMLNRYLKDTQGAA